jgi:large subunit ribosomal protein L25
MATTAASTTAKHYISLAKTLPPNLQRFFARYPPARILDPLPNGAYPRTGYQADRANPFLPKKHPVTGRTHDPVYSLRRQADLVKQARNYGVEDLLPYTPKKTEEQLKHRVKYGLRVKGTGVDQKQMAVKYVSFEAVLLFWARLLLGGAPWADFVNQDGEEERGHAQDAGAYQGMESGKFDSLVPRVAPDPC